MFSSPESSASENEYPVSSSSDSESSENIAVLANSLDSSDDDSSDLDSDSYQAVQPYSLSYDQVETSDSDSSDSAPSTLESSDSDSSNSNMGRKSRAAAQRRARRLAAASISRDDSDSEDFSTALVGYSLAENPMVTQLQNKIGDLQSQLRQMGAKADTLRRDYEQKCSASLQDAITGLLTLAETVSKADKQIVFWYEKGKVLKVVLRPLGINKKTSVIVERKTTKLKNQVASVERQFASTSLVCKDALTEVQTLNRRVNEYSQTGIGSVQDEVVETLSTFDEKKRTIESEIREKEVECDRVSNNIGETNAGIDRTSSARDCSSEGRDNATVTSILSFGGAIGLGVVSIFCPPVAFAAGAAALVGTGSTVAAVSLNDEVNELERLHDTLSSQLSSLSSEIASLRAALPALERQKTTLTDASMSVQTLESTCLEMRQGANALSSLLLKDRQLLSHARMRTERIASDLRSVEYCKTRREITTSLSEILQDLGQVGGTGIENTKALRMAIGVVRNIESQTPKLLMILEKAR